MIHYFYGTLQVGIGQTLCSFEHVSCFIVCPTQLLSQCIGQTIIIGADYIGAIAPTAKKLWGRRPQVARTGILLCQVFETVN